MFSNTCPKSESNVKISNLIVTLALFSDIDLVFLLYFKHCLFRYKIGYCCNGHAEDSLSDVWCSKIASSNFSIIRFENRRWKANFCNHHCGGEIFQSIYAETSLLHSDDLHVIFGFIAASTWMVVFGYLKDQWYLSLLYVELTNIYRKLSLLPFIYLFNCFMF